MTLKNLPMKKKSHLTAKTANKYDLYEESVQNVDFEVEFISKIYKRKNKIKCKSIREDFCASAKISSAWVKDNKNNIAYAVDFDQKILDFAKTSFSKNMSRDELDRLKLIKGNSLTKQTAKVDCVSAFNFSYWVFKERSELIKYFKNAYKNLNKKGLLMLDAFGGYEAHQELEEKTQYKNFTYCWDQSCFNPITNELTCYIHFEFKDGSSIKKAFEYNWRLWSLPEIRECLLEAGFKSTDIYMQGWDDEKEEETEEFTKMTSCDADPGWIAYIIASK